MPPPRKPQRPQRKQPQLTKRRKRKIVFDPEARRDYLCGFSERKRQRRAYGLAMQKCKDRQQKLDDRKQTKQAELEQVVEAERLKQDHVFAEEDKDDNDSSDEEQFVPDTGDTSEEQAAHETPPESHTITYQDVTTKKQFGGAVIVTTSTIPLLPGESNDEIQPSKKHSIDEEQRYAGNVNKFLHELKGHMPSKKKHAHGVKHKGRHGAASMKGMGGAADMKLARKTLTKIQKQQSGGKRGHHKKR